MAQSKADSEVASVAPPRVAASCLCSDWRWTPSLLCWWHPSARLSLRADRRQNRPSHGSSSAPSKASRGGRGWPHTKTRSTSPWDGPTAKIACWVRRLEGEQFQVLAINCTHLGCPVPLVRTLAACSCAPAMAGRIMRTARGHPGRRSLWLGAPLLPMLSGLPPTSAA